jgi:uncharacterized membrane protein
MSLSDRLLAAFIWFLAVLVIAGLTHIIAIFALPGLVANDLYAWTSRVAKPGQLTILTAAQPEKPFIPFADPAMVQAICPFDLSQGDLRLHADVDGDRLLVLSFHTAAGKLFYSMTDLAAHQGKMDVVVLTAQQLEIVESGDDEENPSQDLRLLAPESRGFVLAKALALLPGEKAEAEERLKLVSCSVEQIAQE